MNIQNIDLHVHVVKDEVMIYIYIVHVFDTNDTYVFVTSRLWGMMFDE